VGGKRLRAEVLLAVAASPPASPPPSLDDLVRVPDPLLGGWVPDDLARLLALLPGADLYLQDEVEVALHPTLSRVWCAKGRRGQRLVEAPGTNDKRYGFGLVDWRTGWFDWSLETGRCAVPFCAQLRRALKRSARRKRIAIVLCDNLSIHTPRGSRLLRELLAEVNATEERLVLVYTPAYDPDANRIEWLWRALRRAVTHCHTRRTLGPLLVDADEWATALTPRAVLTQIGSPCMPPLAARPRALQAARHTALTRAA
jgi:transposase